MYRLLFILLLGCTLTGCVNSGNRRLGSIVGQVDGSLLQIEKPSLTQENRVAAVVMAEQADILPPVPVPVVSIASLLKISSHVCPENCLPSPSCTAVEVQRGYADRC